MRYSLYLFVALVAGCLNYLPVNAIDPQDREGQKAIGSGIKSIDARPDKRRPDADLPDELKSLFNTLDRLSPQSVWTKPLVRLEIMDMSDPEGKQNTKFENGILIEQNKDWVAIWNSQLRLQRIPLHDISKVVISNLPDEAGLFKEQLRVDQNKFKFEEISAIYWARIAHAYEETTLRDELVNFSKSLLKDKPLSHLTDSIIPYEEYLRIIISFEDTQIPREKILEDLVRFESLFPTYKEIQEVSKLRDDVRSLVDEDAKKEKFLDFEKLPDNEKIFELIYQLRNQDERSLLCMRFPSARQWNRHKAESCSGLCRLGFNAVPQLVEAVSDQRPTRIVDRPRIFANTAEVVTIGQCAELILRKFTEENTVDNSDSVQVRQASYRNWFAKVEKEGAETYLIRIVEKGGESSTNKALLLAVANPQAALKAIPKAIGNSTQTGTRAELYTVMCSLGEEGYEYLKVQQAIESDPLLVKLIADLLSTKNSGDTK